MTKWTQPEHELLVKLKQEGRTWREIGYIISKMGNLRTTHACRMEYQRETLRDYIQELESQLEEMSEDFMHQARRAEKLQKLANIRKRQRDGLAFFVKLLSLLVVAAIVLALLW